MHRAVRVLQFADVINRHDFIDVIVQGADPGNFRVATCVRSADSKIAAPAGSGGGPSWLLGGNTRRALPRTVWRVVRLLREWDVDILHSHHYDQSVIGWLATRLHRSTRHVVGRHYSDAIYRLPRGHKRQALLSLEQRVNSAASRIIVPSVYILDLLATRQGVRREKIDVIPYGFEPRKYSHVAPSESLKLRQELGLGDELVLGTFARLHEEKGHRFLLEALCQLAPRLSGLTLLVVGEGPERLAIERQIGASGLTDRVRLLGWRRDAIVIMSAVDIVVQPTLHEAFSQVMVEALWMRKPLIMTDVSGTAEVVRDGETALLVRKGNAQALAHAIERLADDDSLRSRVGNNGRAYVEANLCVEKIIPLYEEAYLRALAG